MDTAVLPKASDILPDVTGTAPLLKADRLLAATGIVALLKVSGRYALWMASNTARVHTSDCLVAWVVAADMGTLPMAANTTQVHTSDCLVA